MSNTPFAGNQGGPSVAGPCAVCGSPVMPEAGVCLVCAGRQMEHSIFGGAGQSAVEAPPPAPPEVPGWEVQRLLDTGGMGQIWMARRCGGTQAGVVKVAAGRGGSAAEARLETEAEIMASLEHPHILGVLDIATTGDDRLAIITEYVSGCDLRRLLRAERMPVDRALDIFLKVCSAVAHAHGRRVIHRDLKPSNILVDAAGTVKVADFGLARDSGRAPSWQTSAGDGLGTPYYLAPELLRDAAGADARADVYALGVLLYELLTGTVPLGTYAPLSKLCGLDRAWDGVIRSALMPDREQRTPDVASLQEAVQRLRSREHNRGLWHRRRRTLAVVGGLAISGLAGAALTKFYNAPVAPPVFVRPETAAPGKPWVNSLGMSFLPVPGTGLLMGVHEVRMRDFAVFREYDRQLRPAYRRSNAPRKDIGVLTDAGWEVRDQHSAVPPEGPDAAEYPAFGVYPVDAQFFCAWLTLREQNEGRLAPGQHYRLPRVSEWRAAAAGTDPMAGNFAGPEAAVTGWPPNRPATARPDEFPRSAPWGRFPANPSGFFDMAGNISEIAVPDDGVPDEESLFVRGLVRLGGSWADVPGPDFLEEEGKPTRRQAQREDIGFRCVLDLEAPADPEP